MNRRLWLVLCGGGVIAAGSLVLLTTTPPAGNPFDGTGPALVESARLPAAVFERGEHKGKRVRLAFSLPLTPTPDPRVFEYRPGIPSNVTAPTYRIEFERPPQLGSTLPVVLVGTVGRILPDSRVRINRVPGCLLLTGAAVVPRESP